MKSKRTTEVVVFVVHICCTYLLWLFGMLGACQVPMNADHRCFRPLGLFAQKPGRPGPTLALKNSKRVSMMFR